MDDSQETNTEVQVKPGSENLKYECHDNGRFQCLPVGCITCSITHFLFLFWCINTKFFLAG